MRDFSLCLCRLIAAEWLGRNSASQVLHYRAWMQACGRGMSIGTPPAGITAPVVVVSTFEELEHTDVRNKIVVYNAPFVGYGQTVSYRTQGPNAS